MDMSPDEMARFHHALSVVVRERATTKIVEINGEEVTFVTYVSPYEGGVPIGTVRYDWEYDGLWEASSLREDMGSYETHDEAVAEVVWYAPHASSSWDRYILVGDAALIRTWMSAPDVQDAVRLAFPGRDLPVREVTSQEAHRLLARAGRI